MLAEINENIKQKVQNTKSTNPSPKNINRIFKENQVHFNIKDLLIKSSKLCISEPPLQNENFFIVETNKIKQGFLKKIIENESSKCPLKFRESFLKNHKITAELRTRMVI